MYMAKEAGKGRYQVFEPAMHDTALRRLELKADLQRAIDSNEFVLHYQPVIVLQTGEIDGFEALVRWQHPERGSRAAARLHPARRGDRAHRADRDVGAARGVPRGQVPAASRSDAPPLHMAVNLSARQLQRPELVARGRAGAPRHRPRRLERS